VGLHFHGGLLYDLGSADLLLFRLGVVVLLLDLVTGRSLLVESLERVSLLLDYRRGYVLLDLESLLVDVV